MTSLAQLTDASLHCELKRLVGRSNTLVAQLLAHLGEVESRGIHRERACASLYAYCIYELLMSEDEAQRRCRAARLARQFPLLLDMLAEASLHLTGLLLIGPHLTEENHAELLARARFRTKREIERLVAQVAPCRDVPSQIVPLHCTSAADSVSPLDDDATPGSLARPRTSWAAYVRSLAGAVRQMEPGLAAGQAPPRTSDEQAADSTLRQAASAVASELESSTQAQAISDRADDVQTSSQTAAIDDQGDARARTRTPAIDDRGDARARTRTPAIDDQGDGRARTRTPAIDDRDDVRAGTRTVAADDRDDVRAGTRTAAADDQGDVRASTRTPAIDDQGDVRTGTRTVAADVGHDAGKPVTVSAPEQASSVPPPAELRYKVQFTADQAYVDLLEEARNLLQHQLPTRDLVEVQRRALELLVRKLRQRKHAASERPRRKAPEPAHDNPEPKSISARPPAPEPAPHARHSTPRAAPPARHPRASPPVRPPAPGSAPDARHSTPRAAPPARHAAPKSTQQGRYISAAVRRSVWQRDGARCTYVDARGQRCREQSGLEFHHQHPHARRGPASVENLTLRCRSHNALAAEQDFGRDVIRQKRRAARAKAIRAGAAP